MLIGQSIRINQIIDGPKTGLLLTTSISAEVEEITLYAFNGQALYQLQAESIIQDAFIG